MFDSDEEIDIGNNDQEVLDDAPEQQQESDDQAGADDKETYSRKVQKRIDKLVYERKLEQELRQKETRELMARIAELEGRTLQQEHEKQTSELSNQRQALFEQRKEALEIGDYDKVNELDDKLMDLKIAMTKTAGQKQPAPKQQSQQPPVNSETEIPKAQAVWEQNNPWVFDSSQKSRLEKAQSVFNELLKNGYSASDPETFDILDSRLKRQSPPSAPVDRSGIVGDVNGKESFSADDKTLMRKWGLDPDNADHRKQWIKNKGK